MTVRRLQLVALGALALASAAPAHGTAELSTLSTLTVEPRRGSFDGDRRLSVVLDLRGETAAPGRISIHAPRQFQLDPQRHEGAPVGHAEIHLRNGRGPLLRYAGTISAAPTDAAVMAACSPDEVAGAWIIRASRGGKTLQLPVTLASGTGTRLDLCPPAGLNVAAVVLSLADVRTPAAPGSYAWRAVVTPRSKPGAAYELRAIVPVPHVLTLRGRFVSELDLAHLTGTLRARGKPRQRTEIQIVRLDRTVVPLAFNDSWDGFVRTTERGAFTIYLPQTRT